MISIVSLSRDVNFPLYYVFTCYSLQAPLLCPEDTTEPDDQMFSASQIELGGSYKRVFDTAADEDWFRLGTDEAQDLVFTTTKLGSGVDTVVEVIDVSGNVLASDNDSGAGSGSLLKWQPPTAGIYYLRVVPDDGSQNGCTAKYELTFQEPSGSNYRLFMPSVLSAK